MNQHVSFKPTWTETYINILPQALFFAPAGVWEVVHRAMNAGGGLGDHRAMNAGGWMGDAHGQKLEKLFQNV